MKVILFLTSALLQLSVVSQTVSADSMNRKWTKATINIQCTYSMMQYFAALGQASKNHMLPDSIIRLQQQFIINNPIKSNGSAIFVVDKGNYYLLSARHVFQDPTALRQGALCNWIRLIDNPAKAKIPDYVRVDTFANVTTVYETASDDIHILNGMFGKLSDSTYIFSDSSEDLAIVDLSIRPDGEGFIKTLLNRKYEPIKLSDIDSQCYLKKDQDIIAVGYPEHSIVKKYERPAAAEIWMPSEISIPIVSMGKIARPNVRKKFFEGNIFTYHGSSGGAIVRNNKLIGIVSRFENDTTKSQAGDLLYFVSHFIFIKSSLIMPLLRSLQRSNAEMLKHE